MPELTDAQKAALAAMGGNSEVEPTDDTPVDMDALLNESLDNIPDIADYVTPKEGMYQVKVLEVNKNHEVGDATCIQITYEIVELLQAKGSESGDDTKPGDKFSQLYFMSTFKGAKFNQGLLKKLLLPVALRFGTSDLGSTLDAYAGTTVAAQIKHRRDRDDKTRVYASVSKIVFMD